jgi:hypothetical protein
MKWRNTKERELFSSKTSIHNEKTDCCDYQPKEEIPSIINPSYINENIHSRRE